MQQPIQICIPACVMRSEFFTMTSLYSFILKNLWKIFENVYIKFKKTRAGRNFITALRVNSLLFMHAGMHLNSTCTTTNRFRLRPNTCLVWKPRFFLRFCLLSKHIWSLKMHLFKNALQSEDFWERELLVYVLTDENRGFLMQWCHTFVHHLLLAKPMLDVRDGIVFPCLVFI